MGESQWEGKEIHLQSRASTKEYYVMLTSMHIKILNCATRDKNAIDFIWTKVSCLSLLKLASANFLSHARWNKCILDIDNEIPHLLLESISPKKQKIGMLYKKPGWLNTVPSKNSYSREFRLNAWTRRTSTCDKAELKSNPQLPRQLLFPLSHIFTADFLLDWSLNFHTFHWH